MNSTSAATRSTAGGPGKTSTFSAGDEQPHREQQAVARQEREEQPALDEDDHHAEPEQRLAEPVEQPLGVHPVHAEQQGVDQVDHAAEGIRGAARVPIRGHATGAAEAGSFEQSPADQTATTSPATMSRSGSRAGRCRPNSSRRCGSGRARARLRAEEDRPGGEPVAILSHGLWQRRFGGDPRRRRPDVMLDGGAYTVVGVMPPDFEFRRGPSCGRRSATRCSATGDRGNAAYLRWSRGSSRA